MFVVLLHRIDFRILSQEPYVTMLAYVVIAHIRLIHKPRVPGSNPGAAIGFSAESEAI